MGALFFRILSWALLTSFHSPVTGQPIDIYRGGKGQQRTPYGASAAPPARDGWHGGRTPMAAADSSRTPAWGAAASSRSKFPRSLCLSYQQANHDEAPAWAGASGSRTPAWKMDGSRTAYDGSRTAYGGFGGRTPAWNSGARTPYAGGSDSSGFDAFAAGSRTPAWGAPNPGNRTPAWSAGASSSSTSDNKGYDAPTPGGNYSAPTPGAYGSAPTPGASAPTPGGWADSAPTPGALNAPTPGAPGSYGGKKPYDAPTPAAGRPYDAPTPATAATPAAEDDGPRYEEGTPSP